MELSVQIRLQLLIIMPEDHNLTFKIYEPVYGEKVLYYELSLPIKLYDHRKLIGGGVRLSSRCYNYCSLVGMLHSIRYSVLITYMRSVCDTIVGFISYD